MNARLTVVTPFHDEAEHLPATIDALVAAVERSSFVVDVMFVDDGSTDDSADVAEARLDARLPSVTLRQPNRGRFEARRAGLHAATGESVLFLDARVRLEPESLRFVAEKVAVGATVWNGHVHVRDEGRAVGVFWRLLAELAWRDYFDDPRETSFDDEDFDRYPKGTGCFLAPRDLLLEAMAAFSTRFDDSRRANDDATVIRWIARRVRINLAPSFACEYTPRSSLRTFARHALHRGVVFLDGHGRRGSRFLPGIVAFYPLSAAVVLVWLRRPLTTLVVFSTSVAAASAAFGRRAGRSPREVRALAVLAPVYAVAHGAGMWLGLGLATRDRLRRRLRS